tara:strand:+ start:128 stop:2530 length:2403 start_codon:yes stop_codon:yes gene_type:complete
MRKYLKNIYPHFLCFAFIAGLSLTYFYPVLNNKSIDQSDISQFRGMAKKVIDHRKTYNEEPYWLDNAFLGMPSYQVSVKYPFDFLGYIDQTIRFLPRPADYLFLYMFSFYILIIFLNYNWRYALFGSIAFGFSTYMIIILGVGHNTKALALGYLPLVVLGTMLIFNKKYLKGFLIKSLALGLQIHANHYQMTYYTLILIGIMFLVYLYEYYKKNDLKEFVNIFLVLFSSFVLALLLNATPLLATREYSEFSTRSTSEITINPDGSDKEKSSGLSKEYITEYSYGILESFNLLIPRFMGGSSSNLVREDSKLMDFIKSLDPNQAQQVYQYSRTYWGNQPIVAAPAYVGASILFIFFLSIFLVKNVNMRWISISIMVSLILSWGKNFDFLTSAMIDFFPFYDKFRAVSSIQVLLEFCIPLLAVIGISMFFSNKVQFKLKKKSLLKTSLIFIPLLIIYFFGDLMFSFTGQYEIFSGYPEILNLLIEERKYLLKSDALRSMLIILALSSVLFIYLKNVINKNIAIYIIFGLVIIDLWGVDRRHVNSEQFISKIKVNSPFSQTNADRLILQDDSDFRVYEPQGGFSNARTSFFHNSISGYHAAKPKKIQDIYEFYISKNNMPIMSMLNVKYFIRNDPNNPAGVTRNPNNLGNAWFVNEIKNVENSNQELLDLDKVNLKNTAITQQLPNKRYPIDNSSSINLVKRKSNHLVYKVKSNYEQFVVFSEAFYKNGWKSTINSKIIDHYRVNYLLRGMEVPKGEYEIHFKFEPQVINQGSIIRILAYIIFIIVLVYYLKKTIYVQKNSKT